MEAPAGDPWWLLYLAAAGAAAGGGTAVALSVSPARRPPETWAMGAPEAVQVRLLPDAAGPVRAPGERIAGLSRRGEG